MKFFKVMALAAVAFVSATVANAQELGDSHSRVYAGYNNFSFFNADESSNGFVAGYEYNFNCSGRVTNPLFISGGLEYMLATQEHASFQALSIPVNFKYAFGSEKFAVTPYVGQAFRFGLVNESDVMDSKGNISSISLYDLDGVNRFQIMFNAGLDFQFNKFSIGYRFQVAETKMGTGESDYNHSFMLGYKF